MNYSDKIILGKIAENEDEILIYLMTPKDVDESIELLHKSFIPYENLAIATDCVTSSDAEIDFNNLVKSLVPDGVSLVARHVKDNKIVALAINRLVLPANNPDTTPDIEFNSKSMQCVMDCLCDLESAANLFQLWNIDCIFELVMITTDQDYRQKRIANKIADVTVQLARQLFDGHKFETIPKHLQKYQPKGVYSIFTSKYSQKLGLNLNFNKITSKSYDDYEYEEKKFSEKLNPVHKACELWAIKF